MFREYLFSCECVRCLLKEQGFLSPTWANLTAFSFFLLLFCSTSSYLSVAFTERLHLRGDPVGLVYLYASGCLVPFCR